MIIYRNTSTDPYFNLASEQYLLDTKQGEIFMLWKNSSSVIIGKNQNAYAELDLDFVKKNNIKVVRRLTGGGAVFHDLGNINFSFIVPRTENEQLDFKRFTQPITEALESLGVKNVCLSGRNDITVNGFKVSGNAQSAYNGKTLHHGTLLYSADMSLLVGALRVDEEKIKAKGIKSVRNRVANIKDYLESPPETDDFLSYLESYTSKLYGTEIVDFTDEDKRAIQKLADEKYSSWDWNFGKSKEYSVQKKRRYGFGGVCANICLEFGLIKDISITGDYFGTKDVGILEGALKGVRFEADCIFSEIQKIGTENVIAGMNDSELVDLLLS